MRVLIADKLSERAVAELESMGAEVTFDPGLTAEDLPAKVENKEILIVRSTKVTSQTIEKGKELALIIRAGAGVNTIDLLEASARGIHVANCPGKNADAVAELAIGLMISADRRIADCTEDLRKGVWNKKLYGKAAGLRGRTLSIIGFGSIGKKTAEIARAMGMEVAAWSRSLTPETSVGLNVEYCASPIEAAAIADVLTVHLAAGKDTKHFINEKIFNAMKEGAIFINTSRGEVVNTDALTRAVKSKGIKAALDVYENEPAAGDKRFPHEELAGLITGTHHIGASTEQASEAIADEVVNIVRTFRETGTPLNLVNHQEKSTAVINLVVRHFNKVGVLAAVLDELRSAQINVEEMNNSIFSGGKAAVCTLKLDSLPSGELLRKLNEGDYVIKATLK